MKSRLLFAGLAIAAIGLSTSVPADEIYKWTDAEGNIHYQDRPAPDASVERLRLSYTRTNNEAVQDRVKTRLDSQTQKREANEAAAADAEKAAEKQAEDERIQKSCDKYHARLNMLGQVKRLYREDENGERVYLDDTQREAARAKANALINEHCNS